MKIRYIYYDFFDGCSFRFSIFSFLIFFYGHSQLFCGNRKFHIDYYYYYFIMRKPQRAMANNLSVCWGLPIQHRKSNHVNDEPGTAVKNE